MDYQKLLKQKEQELQIFISQSNIRIGEIQGQIKLLKDIIKENETGKDKNKNDSKDLQDKRLSSIAKGRK